MPRIEVTSAPEVAHALRRVDSRHDEPEVRIAALLDIFGTQAPPVSAASAEPPLLTLTEPSPTVIGE